ncbi:MAG: hypothetical protein ABEJ35_04100 [Halobacteriaceae archaeon]
MRAWLPKAATYAVGYAGGIAVLAFLVGLVPGVPAQGPLFGVSIIGAFLAFLSMWGDQVPTLATLPRTRGEALPVPWRMFLLGIGLFAFTWLVMLLPIY